MGKYVLEYHSHTGDTSINIHGKFVADKLPQVTKYLREFTYCVNGNRIRTHLIEEGLYNAICNARSGRGIYIYTIRYDRNM